VLRDYLLCQRAVLLWRYLLCQHPGVLWEHLLCQRADLLQHSEWEHLLHRDLYGYSGQPDLLCDRQRLRYRLLCQRHHLLWGAGNRSLLQRHHPDMHQQDMCHHVFGRSLGYVSDQHCLQRGRHLPVLHDGRRGNWMLLERLRSVPGGTELYTRQGLPGRHCLSL
jgi:hypothetical protein